MNQPLAGGFYFGAPSLFDREPWAAPRKFRVLFWVIVIVNVLFLAWMVLGVKSVANSTCTASMTQVACDAAKAGSRSVGTLMAGLIWAAVNVIFSGFWLATHKKEPTSVYAQQSPVQGLKYPRQTWQSVTGATSYSK